MSDCVSVVHGQIKEQETDACYSEGTLFSFQEKVR